VLKLHLGSPLIASRHPFIYIGFSQVEHVAYVGETLDKRGAMGRWTDHLSQGADRSSFRRRLDDHDDTCFGRIEDFQIVAFDLGHRAEFVSRDTGFRQAVEYRVQRGLLTRPGGLNPYLQFVSFVRTSSVRVDLPFIVDAATAILDEFLAYYDVL
jgi:hypothetical protein